MIEEPPSFFWDSSAPATDLLEREKKLNIYSTREIKSMDMMMLRYKHVYIYEYNIQALDKKHTV